MPRLDLVPEDDLDLPGVLAVRREERAQDVLDRERDLGREWADVVHCRAMNVPRLIHNWLCAYLDYRDVRKTSRVCGASYLPAMTKDFWKEGWRAIFS